MMVQHDISSLAQTLPRLSLLSILSPSSSSSSSSPLPQPTLSTKMASSSNSCPPSPSTSLPSTTQSPSIVAPTTTTTTTATSTSSAVQLSVPATSAATKTSTAPTTTVPTITVNNRNRSRSPNSREGERGREGVSSTQQHQHHRHRLSLPRPMPISTNTMSSSGRFPVRMSLDDPRVKNFITKPLSSHHYQQSSFGGSSIDDRYSQSRSTMSLSSSTAAQQQEQAYVPTSETSSRPTMNESRHAQSSHPNSRAYNGDTDAGRPHDFEQQRLRGHDRHNGSVDHEFLHQAQPRYPSNHHDYTVRHFEGEDHYQHAHARQELRGHVAAGMEHGSISYGGSSQSSVYLKPERQPQQHLPGRLPSPSPTVAPTSPDWQTVSRPQHDHYQQQHPQHHHLQPQRAQQQHHTLPLAAPQQSNNGRLQAYSHRSATNLISPCISEVDMGTLPDTRALPPLFSSSPVPAFSSPQQQQQSQGGVSMLSSRLLPPPAGMMKQDDAFEARVASPPALHSTTWSSKHHHHRIPIRSPVRGSGQELMTTSTTDSQSSEYMKMDFYDIYLRNPKLLRPQGGRSDERAMMVHQHQGQHTLPTHQHHQQQRRPSEEYGQWHSGPAAYSYAAPPSIIEPSKPKAVKRSPSTGLSRRQSMPLMSTATRRVLRHEDAHLRNQQDDNVVQSLMVGGHHRRGSTTKHNSMSIRNLLTHDHDRNHDQDTHNIKMEQFDDQSSTSSSASSVYSDGGSNSSGEYTELGSSVVPYASSSTYGDNKPLIKKRKKTTSATAQDEGEEPKKRKRISKKQLLESGGQLLDEEGNPIMKKRKRTKKPTDPDHVSPSGFRHGGERVVQEPEELVVLEPDVGPISMLDVKNPPRVIWKGQPLSVVGKPGFDQLHPHEEYIAATLRLSPAQYLTCKRTLILASREYLAKPDGKQFRKSDAQKLCRIDVNKTSRLWEVFAKIGWLAGISERDI